MKIKRRDIINLSDPMSIIRAINNDIPEEVWGEQLARAFADDIRSRQKFIGAAMNAAIVNPEIVTNPRERAYFEYLHDLALSTHSGDQQ